MHKSTVHILTTVAAIAQCEFCCVLTLAFIRCGVSKVMKIQIVVFWFMIQCNLVYGYQHFGRTYCLHLQGSKFSGFMVFWVMTLCNLIGRYEHLKEHSAANMHLPWRCKQLVPPKWYSGIRLLAVITKMSTIWMVLQLSSHYCLSDKSVLFHHISANSDLRFLTQIQKYSNSFLDVQYVLSSQQVYISS
jgi:hypothetical protein